jgi:pSer/pThr/pTyr-binding forkhead associated (FHA) protein
MSVTFVCNGKAKKVDLKNNATLTIGRSSSNNLKIKDRKISRNHCKIVVTNSVPVVHDLGASRGTRVNGHRVVAKALKPGDAVKVGEVRGGVGRGAWGVGRGLALSHRRPAYRPRLLLMRGETSERARARVIYAACRRCRCMARVFGVSAGGGEKR